MANLMHRFLRNQSCLRAIPRLAPSLIPHQKPCIVESVSEESDPVSLANPVITAVVEEEVVIYADSVKKKRKKKMNKHKYRKTQGRKS
ncbi:unnamed protein product [Brassica oleracea var. botrytis]|uniref:Ribosomal protein mS38 C-terminal domain-containing protein n=1 Tax=Brassica oleracea TaxID=3712 RepID=A0A3P6BAD1_BRAOL|nr:unnamed protein product [Brassica oleracea]